MIQGNFYERLHVSMDSCAISPMASLFSIAFMLIPIYLRLKGNVLWKNLPFYYRIGLENHMSF